VDKLRTNGFCHHGLPSKVEGNTIPDSFSIRRFLGDCDQQATAYANRLLVPSPKVVFIARFEVPAKSVPSGRPEHKIQDGFSAD
jgi:hypothetical protein